MGPASSLFWGKNAPWHFGVSAGRPYCVFAPSLFELFFMALSNKLEFPK
jgi:hypothetical protein